MINPRAEIHRQADPDLEDDFEDHGNDNTEDTEGEIADGWSEPDPLELALREADRCSRRVFGKQVKRMQNLLAVNGLQREFTDAKPWVRLFYDDSHHYREFGDFDERSAMQDDPSHAAAEWIEAGWMDPELVQFAMFANLSCNEANKLLARLGYHGPADPAIATTDGGLLDVLEQQIPKEKESL